MANIPATAPDTRTAGVTVSGLDHVVLYVKDPAASRRFYVDVLGLTVAHESGTHIFLHCGGQLLGLFAGGDGRTGRELNHLAFSVAAGSRDEIVAALKGAGIAVEGRRGDPDCIYFEDPDGHQLQVVPADRARS